MSNPQDGTLQLAWDPPVYSGTPVLRYDVSWTGGGQASSTTAGLTATGLTNDTQYTFTVIAVNSRGPGPSAEAPKAVEAPKPAETPKPGAMESKSKPAGSPATAPEKP